MCTDAPLILDPLLKWIKQPSRRIPKISLKYTLFQKSIFVLKNKVVLNSTDKVSMCQNLLFGPKLDFEHCEVVAQPNPKS